MRGGSVPSITSILPPRPLCADTRVAKKRVDYPNCVSLSCFPSESPLHRELLGEIQTGQKSISLVSQLACDHVL